MTTVIEPVQTRDHTERMLRWFGVDIDIAAGETKTRISVSGDAELTARDLVVPSDISSAAFLMLEGASLNATHKRMHNY